MVFRHWNFEPLTLLRCIQTKLNRDYRSNHCETDAVQAITTRTPSHRLSVKKQNKGQPAYDVYLNTCHTCTQREQPE